MKKIIMILLMLIVTITLGVSTSKADYPLTVIEKNASATINKTPGTVVIVTPKNLDIKSWIVETGSKAFKFVMPEEALTIRAGYEGEVVTGNRIMVIQTANGSISPETAIVENGGSKTFTITPNTGYEINDVLVDGVSQGTVTSYTFSNVAEEHTIIAIFKEIPVTTTYTVTFNSNGGSGNMSSQTFEEGVAQNLITNTFTKEGYTFAGWSTSESGSVEYINNASYTATSNITLYAVWTTDSYIITYNLDGGSVSGNPTTYNISSETITLNNPAKTGYTFTGWTGSNGETPETTVTIATGSTGNKSYTANWQINTYTITVTQGANGTITPDTSTVDYGTNKVFTVTPNDGYVIETLVVDGVSQTVTNEGGMTYTFSNVSENHTITATYIEAWEGWNTPKLATGLTPVNWNGSSWVTTTESSWDYNYNSVAEATQTTVAGNGNGKWANAQTADGSLYVWIPRYTYKITSGEHTLGKSWNSLDAAGTNKIEIKFSNGTTDDTSDSYIKHPAFTFGTDELQGIWVAKYEASQGNTTSELSAPTSSNSVAKSIPGVASWRSISVSNMFDYAYNTYRNADSHLMKNVEWGAVAYLTNAIGRIPYINNGSNFITGNAGGSQDAAEALGTTNAWNTANGVKASTTHNVYGIYDMSGGAREYVAAYLNNGNSFLSSYASSLVNATSKYKDTYPVGSSDIQANNYAAWSNIKGDAVYETSSGCKGITSWDGDCSDAPYSDYPVFSRGGGFVDASSTGVFDFDGGNGFGVSGYGFRVVLGIR